MTACKYQPYTPKNAGEVVFWCKKNGLIAVPCRPKSKAPLGIISRKGVYGKNPPGERELLKLYDRRSFGKTVRDSFHVPSPERINKIRDFWEKPNTGKLDYTKISISLDMNYPTDDGYTVACVDIDSDSHILLADEDAFSECPLIAGKKGGKIFFKLDRENSVPSPIVQYSTKDNLSLPGPKQESALIELFTGHKHALIYGEHPDSTTEDPVIYHFLRGFECKVPVITWKETTQCLKGYADKNGLAIRMTSEVMPYDQTTLSDWSSS
ncbi:hypothetical protein J2128_001786 [Methanomicrobium sp. W14]|uniref:hypothetical protein n=1 Tax=Methanomicrobium sp. W14 TaxID=2817839 RepID=UPI001AE936C3|nr:hypothetical protein [Methanomicrobium sp. W14]MBP2133832.1 hypothetical protein [Methanomicrobium sp. W14]